MDRNGEQQEMGNVLDQIRNAKLAELAAKKTRFTLANLDERSAAHSAPRGFARALRAAASREFGLIAEIKKASPSHGIIRADFVPDELAKAYEKGGATCLSILTDEGFFQGRNEHLTVAREACRLPVLRKDFILDPWQVAEARSIGADAILLIAALLDIGLLKELDAAAKERNLDVLVEVYDHADLEKAVAISPKLIGFNNRNLRTFETDLAITTSLAKLAPDGALLIAESGIRKFSDLQQLSAFGVRCFLVGESLMRCEDLEQATRMLLGD